MTGGGGFGFDTRAVHAGQRPDPESGARAMPIYASTSFVFEDAQHAADLFSLQTFGNIYSRISNPTNAAFEERMASLEGGLGALAAASGTAAQLVAILTLARSGDHVVSSNALYGGTFTQFAVTLERMGIEVTFVDLARPDEVEAAIRPTTKAIFAETIGNPSCTILDVELYADMARSHGFPLVVDNTFATPYLQQPLRLGADVVVQSMTKYINGHSSSVGGVVVGPHGFIRNHLYPFAKDFGACVSPFESWLNRVTVSTLGHRVEHQCANAQKVAEFLVEHPRITSVAYPGLPAHRHHARAQKQMRLPGAMIAFEMEGGVEPAKKLMNYFARHDTPMELAVSLGSVISYIQHPASMTHAGVPKAERLKSGLRDELVRLSVGIEGAKVLLRALDEGLRLAYS